MAHLLSLNVFADSQFQNFQGIFIRGYFYLLFPYLSVAWKQRNLEQRFYNRIRNRTSPGVGDAISHSPPVLCKESCISSLIRLMEVLRHRLPSPALNKQQTIALWREYWIPRLGRPIRPSPLSEISVWCSGVNLSRKVGVIVAMSETSRLNDII